MTDSDQLSWRNDDAAETAVLDALAWHALTTEHAHLALGDDRARRYQPEVAGFVAVADGSPESWTSLERIVDPGETIMLSGGTIPSIPASWTSVGGGLGFQMWLQQLAAVPVEGPPIRRLEPDDVPRMLALVELTQPGPFRPRTIELGDYFGIFDDDELVAMAGERLRTPTHTEVSAVCTHPSFRGRGYAAALTHKVASGIIGRGQRPVLHLAQTNVGARRVYERLGFAVRRELAFAAVQAPGGGGTTNGGPTGAAQRLDERQLTR